MRILVMVIALVAGTSCDKPHPMMKQPAPLLAQIRSELVEAGLTLPADNILVLNFWATWCTPCRDELPKLHQWQQAIDTEGLPIQILLINQDFNPLQARRFLEQFKIDLPVMFDTSRKIAETYHVEAMPTTVLIDQEGVIQAYFLGYREDSLEKYQTSVRELLNR